MEPTPQERSQVEFVKAYWAWLRGEREVQPIPEAFGLFPHEVESFIQTVKSSDEFRRLEVEQLKERIKFMANLLNRVYHVTGQATVCYNTNFCAPDCPRCQWEKEKLKAATTPKPNTTPTLL